MTNRQKLAAGWKPQRHRWHVVRRGERADDVICLRKGCAAVKKRFKDGDVQPRIQTCLLKAPRREAAG